MPLMRSVFALGNQPELSKRHKKGCSLANTARSSVACAIDFILCIFLLVLALLMMIVWAPHMQDIGRQWCFRERMKWFSTFSGRTIRTKFRFQSFLRYFFYLHKYRTLLSRFWQTMAWGRLIRDWKIQFGSFVPYIRKLTKSLQLNLNLTTKFSQRSTENRSKSKSSAPPCNPLPLIDLACFLCVNSHPHPCPSASDSFWSSRLPSSSPSGSYVLCAVLGKRQILNLDV